MTSSQYRRNYEGIAWTPRVRSPRTDSARSERTFMVMRDIDEFVSPIDGSTVGSRSALREHEKRHNVRQIGNDWAGSERPANWDRIRNGRD
jgi:hypothetical protein